MKTPEERYATAMENFPELVVVRENLFRVMDLLEGFDVSQHFQSADTNAGLES